MEKQIIKTKHAPEPIGPYSQAIFSGNTLYMSGQIALDPETNTLVATDIASETHQVMKNCKAILTEARLDFSHVVKTTIFLTDMSLFASVNEIYGQYFTSSFPARETVAVKGLPKNVQVEISMIAVRSLEFEV